LSSNARKFRRLSIFTRFFFQNDGWTQTQQQLTFTAAYSDVWQPRQKYWMLSKKTTNNRFFTYQGCLNVHLR
jgi:hypothetical protein